MAGSTRCHSAWRHDADSPAPRSCCRNCFRDSDGGDWSSAAVTAGGDLGEWNPVRSCCPPLRLGYMPLQKRRSPRQGPHERYLWCAAGASRKGSSRSPAQAAVEYWSAAGSESDQGSPFALVSAIRGAKQSQFRSPGLRPAVSQALRRQLGFEQPTEASSLIHFFTAPTSRHRNRSSKNPPTPAKTPPRHAYSGSRFPSGTRCSPHNRAPPRRNRQP